MLGPDEVGSGYPACGAEIRMDRRRSRCLHQACAMGRYLKLVGAVLIALVGVVVIIAFVLLDNPSSIGHGIRSRLGGGMSNYERHKMPDNQPGTLPPEAPSICKGC
jgi:hypothetical protein